jgi:hypothetical protein
MRVPPLRLPALHSLWIFMVKTASAVLFACGLGSTLLAIVFLLLMTCSAYIASSCPQCGGQPAGQLPTPGRARALIPRTRTDYSSRVSTLVAALYWVLSWGALCLTHSVLFGDTGERGAAFALCKRGREC